MVVQYHAVLNIPCLFAFSLPLKQLVESSSIESGFDRTCCLAHCRCRLGKKVEKFKRHRLAVPDPDAFMAALPHIPFKSGWKGYVAKDKASTGRRGRGSQQNQLYVCLLNNTPEHQEAIHFIRNQQKSPATDFSPPPHPPSSTSSPPIPLPSSPDFASVSSSSSESRAPRSAEVPVAKVSPPLPAESNSSRSPSSNSDFDSNSSTSSSSSSSGPFDKAYTNWESCPIEDLTFRIKFEEMNEHSSVGGHPMALSPAGMYFAGYVAAGGKVSPMLRACKKATAAAQDKVKAQSLSLSSSSSADAARQAKVAEGRTMVQVLAATEPVWRSCKFIFPIFNFFLSIFKCHAAFNSFTSLCSSYSLPVENRPSHAADSGERSSCCCCFQLEH